MGYAAWMLCGIPSRRESCVEGCGVVGYSEERVDVRNVMDGIFRRTYWMRVRTVFSAEGLEIVGLRD